MCQYNMLNLGHNRMNYRYSSGFSLIELMLAMLIGVIIMGGVMQLFVSTRDTQRNSDDQLKMLSAARFVIETISYDLRHAGVWGRHNNSQLVACHSDATTSLTCPTAPLVLATNDCVDYGYINFGAPLIAEDNNNTGFACASDFYLANTDVLSLRYADTNWIDTGKLLLNVPYVRSNIRSGMVFLGPTIPAASYYKWTDDDATSNHLLVSRTYYVSDYTDEEGDGLPSLRRVDLVAGPELVEEVLLPGVEDFQLEFGVDIGTNGVVGTAQDGLVDSYVSASSVTDWGNQVVSVKIWVLMRSEREDRDNIGGTQQFTIAGVKGDVFDDGYRRYLVSSVVKLRNVQEIDLMTSGS